MRRPDVFTLDYSHPLAQGLVFAGIMQMPVPAILQDARHINNFTLQNMESADWVLDYQGRYALQFDGSNERAESTAQIIPFGQGYADISDSYVTFGCKFKPSILTANSSIFCLGGYNMYRKAYLRCLGAAAGDPVSLYHEGSSASSEIISATGLGGDVSSWHTIVGVYSNAYRELWLDGVLQGSSTISVGLSGGNTPVSIGCRAYSTTRTEYFAGAISDPLIWTRRLSPAEIALLADRTDPMLGGLIVEERPVLYFDIGGSTVDALTASNLTISAPVLGSPALGQVHGLAATALTVSAPVLGTPAVGQAHSMTASALVVGSPVLGTPSLSENAPDVDALTANALVVGSPALGSPSLDQIHVLGSDGLVTGSPVLGSPIVRQIHTITALGLTVGAPTIGTPELNKTTIDLDITANLSSVGLDVMCLDSIGTFTVQLTSSGCKLVTLRSVGNFEVAEREE